MAKDFVSVFLSFQQKVEKNSWEEGVNIPILIKVCKHMAFASTAAFLPPSTIKVKMHDAHSKGNAVGTFSLHCLCSFISKGKLRSCNVFQLGLT